MYEKLIYDLGKDGIDVVKVCPCGYSHGEINPRAPFRLRWRCPKCGTTHRDCEKTWDYSISHLIPRRREGRKGDASPPLKIPPC